MKRERERDIPMLFVALICLQQIKPFIAIRALLDLANGDSSDSNETDTYHYSQNDKLWRTKLSCLKFLKGSGCLFLVKLVNWA